VERSHYRVLCVAPDASMEEIEQSFRQLARHLHPDLHGGDGAAAERMKELNVARTTLTDPVARAAYDEQLFRQRHSKVFSGSTPVAPAASAPQPGEAAPWAKVAPAKLAVRSPLLPWMRKREEPPAPSPQSELERFGSAKRVFWFGLLSSIGLAATLLLTWLHRVLPH
jgi:curved DNA-binding protein CbpA